MSESLKAQREKLAGEFARGEWGEGNAEYQLRELQREAMVLAIRYVAAVQLKHDGHELPAKAYSAAELDWLLDAPPPTFPVRCIHCGKIEEAHAMCAHAFEAQSPRCFRAHPHQEPCEDSQP